MEDDALARALAQGPFRIGEVLVRPIPGGGAILCHRSDLASDEAGLVVYDDPEAAAEIARFDDAGSYRPLKGAPNLRRGWLLKLADARALKLALDLIYPGRLGALAAFAAGTLGVTPLRETLGRQSGMYRVTARLSDAQADALVGRFCRSDGGCLRTILWRRDAAGAPASNRLPAEKFDARFDQAANACGGAASSGGPWLPLLCQEACNLLVAEARRVVKGEIEE